MGGSQCLNLPGGSIALLCGTAAGGGVRGERASTSTVVAGHVLRGGQGTRLERVCQHGAAHSGPCTGMLLEVETYSTVVGAGTASVRHPAP